MTRDEIAEALASIGQHHTRAQRELLQLALRLQNEGLTGQTRDMLPARHAIPEDSQEDLLPVVAATTAVSAPRLRPTTAQALATAKEVLKEELINHDQSHLLHLVDTVEQSDIDATHHAPAPTPVTEPSTGNQASVEFFRNIFNAQTLAGGTGPLGIGVAGLKHYQQDVRLARQAHLKNWPSGFYTEHTTHATQFLLNRADLGWAILVEGLQRADIRASTLNYGKEEFASFMPMPSVGLDEGKRERLASCFNQTFSCDTATNRSHDLIGDHDHISAVFDKQ
ncbi:hypothetical protein HDG34_003194 [Paraburkholderia sp. HC6.4b]|uniref:hypothetical protein n=1 Tax=unclassified Paraburkholderia TaxID=2615204 RepID=UPI00160BF735|nr:MULTISPECIES: hypothetical protein [unclassified Paraburkholderia]MBB5409253.1 hypothetical protein [Paraburkholderia sp. HC6.4b]MBB5450981.1 hypothetical protein [Paraburkholderia sp. Kb1A]